MWILTMDVNLHYQYGEYFVAAFDHKPSFQELKTILGEHENDENIKRILNGDGRGYSLREYKSGEVSSEIIFV